MAHRIVRVEEADPALVYDIMVAALAPRPIVMVITLDSGHHPNVAPYSFVMPGGSNPPSVVFSATLNSEGEPKSSLLNAESSREFVLCGVSRAAFESWKLTPGTVEYVDSAVLKTPRVANALYALECRYETTISHGEGPFAARYIVGEIVAIAIPEATDHTPQALAAALPGVARLGDARYLDPETGFVFQPH